MKAGYKAELEKDKAALGSAKAGLEEWYAQRIPEEAIVDEVLAQFNKLMGEADSVMARHVGTIRTVKSAIDASLHVGALVATY